MGEQVAAGFIQKQWVMPVWTDMKLPFCMAEAAAGRKQSRTGAHDAGN